MMQEENDCKGITGWLFGHKFEARYDSNDNQTTPGNFTTQQVPEDILSQAIEDGECLSDILEAMAVNSKKSTYVHDVCVRCGKVVIRQGK